MMAVRLLLIFFVLFISDVNGQTSLYTMQADAGLLLGEGVRPVPGIQVFNGFRLAKEKIETGLTVGVDIYSQFNILPVSPSLKWVPFPQREVRPYLGLNIGYGLAWLNKGTAEKDYQGGFAVNPSFGLRIKTKTKTTINFGLGYKQQRAGIIHRSFDDLGRTNSKTNEKYKFARVGLNFGIGF